MGIRSMNYIALRPGISLPDSVACYLADAVESNDERGTLFVFESNFTPMWARDNQGVNCTSDLDEEVAIQRFLGSLFGSDFYMTRAGAECGHRGQWQTHPFQSNEAVMAIEASYRSLTADEPVTA